MSGNRTKTWNMKDVKKLMKNNGYEVSRHHGDHAIWKNKEGNTIILPNVTPNKMMMKRVIKENNLEV